MTAPDSNERVITDLETFKTAMVWMVKKSGMSFTSMAKRAGRGSGLVTFVNGGNKATKDTWLGPILDMIAVTGKFKLILRYEPGGTKGERQAEVRRRLASTRKTLPGSEPPGEAPGSDSHTSLFARIHDEVGSAAPTDADLTSDI